MSSRRWQHLIGHPSWLVTSSKWWHLSDSLPVPLSLQVITHSYNFHATGIQSQLSPLLPNFPFLFSLSWTPNGILEMRPRWGFHTSSLIPDHCGGLLGKISLYCSSKTAKDGNPCSAGQNKPQSSFGWPRWGETKEGKGRGLIVWWAF